MLPEEVLFVVSMIAYTLSLFLVFIRIVIHDKFFSPSFIYLIFQFFAIILGFSLLYGVSEYNTLGFNKEYLYSPNFEYLSLVAIYYSFFNLFVVFFFEIIPTNDNNKYEQNHNNKEGSYRSMSLFKIYVFSILTYFVFFYLLIIIHQTVIKDFSLAYIVEKSYDTRFFITRGINYLFFSFLNIFPPAIIYMGILKVNELRKKQRVILILNLLLLLLILLIFPIYSGIRGLIIFNFLFLLYLLSKDSVKTIFKKIVNMKISKKYFYFLLVIQFLLILFYFYSVTRGMKGNIISLFSQRADFFVNSYIALLESHRFEGIRLEKFVYFLEYLIPRELLMIIKEKNYPSTVDVTWILFHKSERFGAEMGILTESFYVFNINPMVYSILAAFLVSIIFKSSLKYIRKKNPEFKDIIMLKLFYMTPTMILNSGILNPTMAELLNFGLVVLILHKLRIL